MPNVTRAVLLGLLACFAPRGGPAQTSPLLQTRYFRAIRDESSGELPLVTFRAIQTDFAGFSPSKGGNQIAQYLAARMREYGLEKVVIDGFPADGRRFFWTFLTEPAWDADAGTLTLLEPRRERLADYAVHRVVLGRFSSSANVTAELVDVGAGTSPSDYEGKDVRGKIVLASGDPGAAHGLAVWRHGAAGLVWYRTADAIALPHLVANPAILPWSGPHGEAPGFAFGVSYATGVELRDWLRRGQRVQLEAQVRATTGAGEYQQVNAVIPGSDAGLPEVWINAHDNYRNTGGGNNLTGVGATVEIARVLGTLITRGALPRPRRNIRFLWGAEHFSSVYNFHHHPEWRGRVLAFLNVDMVGYHQERAKAVFHLYRLPHSMPHFLSDVAEEFMHAVGRANTVTVREAGISAPVPGGGEYDPVFAPTGSRDQLHYSIEEFWGPSDHEDVVEASIGVPAVLYNDWPDPYIGTQEDDLTRADPTQMRRAVITVAATAYYLASIPPDGATTLAPLLASDAQARMAAESRKAFALLGAAGPESFAAQYREAVNLLAQAFAREKLCLQSLEQLGDAPTARAAIARARRQVEATHGANLAALRDLVAERAAAQAIQPVTAVPTPEERRLAALVPTRADSIRGPVHFFRPEYGVAWLRQKTGTEDFRNRVPLTSRGHYVLYEALNFADGKRSLLEIRDAVSSEYGPVAAADLEAYFRFLESVGVVSLGRPAQARR